MMPMSPHSPHHAIYWMLLTGVLAVSVIAIAKFLTPHFHPFQLMFFYCAGGALVLLPIVVTHYQHYRFWQHRLARTPAFWRLHVFRAACEFIAFSLSFYAIAHLPLPTQTAISFSSPIFASLFAVWWLHERPDPRKWCALALGMIGVLIISDPLRVSAVSIPLLPILATTLAAVVFGVCGILIKRATFSAQPLVIAFLMLTLTALISLPFAVSVWQEIPASTWLWLLLLSLCTGVVQYTVAKALSLGQVTSLVPLAYLNLIWSSLFAYVFFAEIISLRTISGSLCIVAAAFLASGWKQRKL